jgi:ribose 1,5-bisphosphokinase PhnN
MIKLPEYKSTQRSQGLPSAGFSTQATPEAFGAGIGRGIGDVANVLAEQAKRDKDAADTTAVMEADRKLADWEISKVYGDDGALRKKGRDTLGLPKQLSDDFDSFTGEVAGSLANDTQRQAFAKLSASRRPALQRTLYAHSAQEMDSFYDQETKGYLDTSRNAAALNYNNPQRVQAEIERGSRALLARSVSRGQAPEATNAELQQYTSGVHRDVLTRLLDEDPQKAQQYLQKNQDKFTANDLLVANHSVLASVERAQERQRIMVEKRDRDAVTAVNQLESNSELGIPTSPTTLAAVQSIVKGTSAEPMLAAYMDRQQALLEFARLPPAEMQQQIEGIRAKIMNGGAADPNKAAALLRSMEGYRGNLVKSLKDDPLKIYQDRTGQQLEPITPQHLMSGAAAQNLRARESALGTIKKNYGDGVADSVLRPEEAEAMRKTFETGTPDQQLSVFKGLFPLSKAGYEAAIRQIGGSDEMVFAGMHYMKGTRAIYEGGSSVPVASLVLDGMAKMKDKSFALPQPGTNGIDGMRVTFNNAIGNALPPGSPAREMAYKATQAIYASLASSSGKFGGVLEPGLLNSAIKFATGGIATVGNEKVLMPYGMKEDDFKDKLAQQIAAAAQRTRLPVASLSNAPLEAISPGRYAVKVGRNYAMSLDGSRLVLEVK